MDKINKSIKPKRKLKSLDLSEESNLEKQTDLADSNQSDGAEADTTLDTVQFGTTIGETEDAGIQIIEQGGTEIMTVMSDLGDAEAANEYTDTKIAELKAELANAIGTEKLSVNSKVPSPDTDGEYIYKKIRMKDAESMRFVVADNDFHYIGDIENGSIMTMTADAGLNLNYKDKDISTLRLNKEGYKLTFGDLANPDIGQARTSIIGENDNLKLHAENKVVMAIAGQNLPDNTGISMSNDGGVTIRNVGKDLKPTGVKLVADGVDTYGNCKRGIAFAKVYSTGVDLKGKQVLLERTDPEGDGKAENKIKINGDIQIIRDSDNRIKMGNNAVWTVNGARTFDIVKNDKSLLGIDKNAKVNINSDLNVNGSIRINATDESGNESTVFSVDNSSADLCVPLFINGNEVYHKGNFSLAGVTVGVTKTVGFTDDCDFKIISAGNHQVEIINAVNSLPDTGGKVILREGNYYINEQISFENKPNITIEGVGTATKLHRNSSNMWSVIYIDYSDNVTIQNLSLLGHNENGASGICIENGENCLVKNVEVQDIKGIGIIYEHIKKSKIIDCRVSDCSSDGIRLCDTQDCEVSGITSKDNEVGLCIDVAHNAKISNNNCSENNNNGIVCTGSAFTGDIVKNTCNGNNCHGIYLDGGGNSTAVITGNICNANRYQGIYLDYCSSCTVSENVCENNQSCGLELDNVTNAVISNNIVSSQIGLYYSNSNIISGNEITEEFGNDLIHIFECSNNVISNNHLESKNQNINGYSAISTYNSNENSLIGNEIVSCYQGLSIYSSNNLISNNAINSAACAIKLQGGNNLVASNKLNNCATNIINEGSDNELIWNKNQNGEIIN